ncbi:MAG: DUF4340 domain-containing protein [Myxococcales bacterium]|nr:DUF4340 domain-containing protein [Myxococcales bacterium]
MRSVALFGTILVVSLAFSWVRYTGGEEKVKEGTILMDGKKEDLQRAKYTSPDLTVEYEVRSDGIGSYGWLTVSENKKKKVPDPAKPGSMMDSTELKLSKFKAGSGNDKLVDGLAPLMAVRALEDVPADKIESFGLTAPDTTLSVTIGGAERAFLVGGETYGTKDRYVKDALSGRIYVVDDEVFKSLKFAATRLPERALSDRKPEEITGVSLGQGASTASWTHKNKDDKAAAHWQRDGALPTAPTDGATPLEGEAPAADPGKDVTFANWVEAALKLKSTAYVQDGDEPATLEAAFDLTLRAEGKPDQTIHLLHDGDDWYARSEFTRGLVKISKGPAEDSYSDVDDILAGKTPPPKAKPAKPAGAPTKAPGGDKPDAGPGGRPPGGPSGMMPRSPGMMPKPGKPAG